MINKSGFTPFGYRCLVKLEEAEEVSEGGIVLVKDTTETEQLRKTRATLIAKGARAFHDINGNVTDNCEPGMTIEIKQYAGASITGPADGVEYQLINDTDVYGEVRDGN